MNANPRMAGFRFGQFTLDLTRGALLAADGTELALRPKSFALLRHLVENAGRLLDRDEIMGAVWPDVIVTEDSITQCVKDVRRALGDEEQRILRTLPRRGYLFAAEVARIEADAGRSAQQSVAEGQEVPRPPADRPLVVVLPFENIGRDPDEAYFASGLTADLVTDLGRFRGLQVVASRAGAARALEPATPGAPISTAGSVPPHPVGAYVVGGSVRRAGGRIRVTATLEDGTSGVQLWADRFDRSLDDLFAVQEELAERIASRLASQVDYERLRLARRRPPATLDAYDLCLRGRELHFRGTEADTRLGREMFERAIEADPDYGPAHAWLAYTVQRGFTHWWGEPRGRAALEPALALAQRAVALEPDSPLCVSRLAFILLLCGHWDEALETARTAVRLNPGAFDTRQAYAQVLTHAGEDPEEAVREYRLTLELDPYHAPPARAELGRALLLAGRHEEALAELRRATARQPDYGPGHQNLVVAAVETGQMNEARAALAEVLRLGPHRTLRSLEALWYFRRAADVQRYRAAFRAVGLPE